ncbi:hypothetical protein JXA02_04720 [candidate division KSB1 bacterium]|nr:hypothetical protein [candidate division KSB1 bacterium]RQW08676.1 MAG: hypothetical protein EH222_05340 [candidate division KSB1 bacterium]
MKIAFLLIAPFLLLAGQAHAKTVGTYKFNSGEPAAGPIGNGVTDLKPGHDGLWIGTGEGLGRYDHASASFASYAKAENLARGSISAIWAEGDDIWIAAAEDSFVASVGESLPFGTGFSHSRDNGATWSHYPQPGPTPIQNLCYDITVVDGIVWAASFGGGLLKSADGGATWQQTAPDSFVFEPNSHLNHRAFSTLNADGILWVGTAGGINKSADNGESWINFNHTNQQNPISGNFVVALANQRADARDIIWAATWKAEDLQEEYGVSKTENGGLTWTTHLLGIRAQNIATDGPTVYVATLEGLYKSPDYGDTWYKFPAIADKKSGENIYTVEHYSVYAEMNTVWAGTADGLARTSDNGYTWDVFRAFKSTAGQGEPRTYAYPNPFSPKRHNELGGDGHVRLQYNTRNDTYVTVKVYDFAMDLVATLCENKFRPGPADLNEVWNGKNDYGDEVANGVYFYSIAIEGDGTHWGKILIVN